MKSRQLRNLLIVSLTVVLSVSSGLIGSRALANVKNQAELLSFPSVREITPGKVVFSQNNMKIEISDVDQTNRMIRLKLRNDSDQTISFGGEFKASGSSIGKKAAADAGVKVEPGTSADLEVDYSGIAALGDPQLKVKVFNEEGKSAGDIRISLGSAYTPGEAAEETAKYVAGLLDNQEALLDNAGILEEQITTLTGEKDELEKQVTSLTGEKDELEKQVTSLTNEKEQLSAQASENETSMTQMAEEITGMSESLAKQEETIRGLEADVEAKSSEIEGLQADVEAKASEIEGLQADVTEKTSEAETLQKNLEEKTGENEELQGLLEAKTAEAEGLKAQLDAKTAEGEALQAQLEEKTAENENLAAELEGVKTNLDELQGVLNQTTEENGRLRLELDPGMMENPADLMTDTSIEYHDWAAVKAIQISLNSAGFDCGPVDCIYGPKTERGIREYQKARGLTENGIITEELVKSLRQEGLLTGTILNHTQKDEYYTYLGYDQISYGSENLVGTRMAVSGKILQNTAAEEGCAGYLRLAVRGENKDVLFVTYHDDVVTAELNEGTEITVYGRCVGYYDYQSKTDAAVSIPWMMADNIEPTENQE